MLEEIRIEVENNNKLEKINFNYEKIKNQLLSELNKYKGLVYTEENLKEAKADRATLNKVAKMLNDKKIEIKKEYMKPFEEFENQIKELVGITKDTSNEIDIQVKEFEDKERQERLLKVNGIIEEINKNGIPYEMLFEDSYLLKSTSEKAIRESLDRKVAKVNEDFQILESLQPIDFEDIKNYYYKNAGALSLAVQEINRQKEIASRMKVIKADEEEKEEFNLTVFCSKKQFTQIKEFLSKNGIRSL